MKKYLLFDADGTLYDFEASRDLAIVDLFNKYAIPVEKRTIDLYEKGNAFCWKEFENMRMTQDVLAYERFRLLWESLGRSDKLWEKAGEDYPVFLGRYGVMIDGAIELLEALKEKYHLVMVTNGIAVTQNGRIDGTDTRKYFDRIFISEEIGFRKPEKEFFDVVLKELGAKREECIVIGDSDSSDILGALNSEIDAIYINVQKKDRDSKLLSESLHDYDALKKLLLNA